jgi:hypothetical protein
VEKHSAWTFIILLAVASARIASTYTVFNHTVDEPGHVACGMEWLQKGTFHFETQHPPLARAAAALGLYLAGGRSAGQDAKDMEGALILYSGGKYDRNLALARLGILPFFWIGAAAVFLWARKTFGPLHAAAAVFFFTFLPAILANAGLATTDMALAAFVAAAFFAGLCWFEKPTLSRAAGFGALGGLAVISKFSAIPFLACAFVAAALWAIWSVRPGAGELGKMAPKRAATLLAAAVAGMLVIWAGYRFSFGYSPFLNMNVPAPEFFTGIHDVLKHNELGHTSYLAGQRSASGFWYFYPVALAVKTPLPFLALLLIGGYLCMRRKNGSDTAAVQPWAGMPAAFAAGILIFAMFFSHINIGTRHVLPVYAAFSVMAAAGTVRLLDRIGKVAWAPYAAGGLMIWFGATSLLAHPDYVPYFNFLAGPEPEKVLVDSDLDWGQDMKRLGRRLNELGAKQVAFNPFIIAYLEAVHGFPHIERMDPETPSIGWNAASVTMMKANRLGLEDQEPNLQLWTERIPPTEKIGNTTYLWYIPPERPLRRK